MIDRILAKCRLIRRDFGTCGIAWSGGNAFVPLICNFTVTFPSAEILFWYFVLVTPAAEIRIASQPDFSILEHNQTPENHPHSSSGL